MHPKWMCAGSLEREVSGGVAGVVTAATLTTAFTLLALGVEQFWVVFIIGFGVVLPTATQYAARRERESNSQSTSEDDTALSRLQERYANGELTDDEFEDQVERLLEAEARAQDGELGE